MFDTSLSLFHSVHNEIVERAAGCRDGNVVFVIDDSKIA